MPDAGHILVSFPEHYRLFEHVKKSEKDGKTEVKNKTHAAGGNDRQDAYLYGHPDGRRKRYRSPADFFPHLLWLCTDESGDPDNCSCKLCCPEDIESIMPGIKTAKPTKPEPDTKQKLPPPQAPIQVRQQPMPISLQPTPLPAIRSLDQQIDSQYRSFRYRPGELCWFRRGSAWGLGVILRRWNQRATQSYTVQPLSHPFEPLDPVIKSLNEEIRPWLAWSVPTFTYAALNELRESPRFDTVDWQAMRSHGYGRGGNMEVDGSILAAKSIDCSYTPINPTATREVHPGQSETYYDGIYIGGERIWVGEPIRLSNGNSTDIMVVHSIVESQALNLIGDIYALETVRHTDANLPSPASPMNNTQLPRRLTEDLAARNAVSIARIQHASFWKLIAVQRKITLDQVKGRWYEASIILPDLHADQFEEMKKRGEIQEAGLFLNARGDCMSANRSPNAPKAARLNIRKQTREEAFAGATPADAQVVDGIDPPDDAAPAVDISENGNTILDPRFSAQNGDDGTLDQFMNLDAVDQGYQQY